MTATRGGGSSLCTAFLCVTQFSFRVVPIWRARKICFCFPQLTFCFLRHTDRNPSNGSGFSDTGSMERPKIAGSGVAAGTGAGLATGTVSSIGSLSSSSASATNTSTCSSSGTADKRKKLEERIESKESRIDARQVIDDLIKSANLENDVNAGEGKTKPQQQH